MASITPETTIVLITGGNQGLGYETVKKLVADHPDYHIILSGRRPDAVNQAVATFTKDGHSVAPLILDIVSEESIKAAVKTVSQTYGHIDVLINNSGIAVQIESVAEEMQTLFRTNVVGTALVTDAFLPLLARSSKTKRIVFVSSTMGSIAGKADPSLGNPFRKVGYRSYCISKAGMNMLAAFYAEAYEDDTTWKINVADPGRFCSTNLNGFTGMDEAALGALASCMFAELGPDGETAKFKSDYETVAW